MPTPIPSSPRVAIPPKFDNGEEFLHGLGDVPLSRVVFDPWPGTATEQDLLEFVERDKRLVELVDGTLVEKPVGYYESLIAALLIRALLDFVLPRKLGAVSGEAGMMRLLSGRVRLPDVAYISFSRFPGGRIPREPIPNIAPDLAVEVLSDSNTKAEIDQKLREYFQSGTRLAWIIDPPSQTVAVHRSPGRPERILKVGESLDGLDVLPGFTMPLAELFQPYP
jgi:Uma2 family endonuclease